MHVCGRGCQSLPPPACNKPRLSHVHDAIVQYLRYFTATEALHTRCAFRVCSVEGVQVMSELQVNFVRPFHWLPDRHRFWSDNVRCPAVIALPVHTFVHTSPHTGGLTCISRSQCDSKKLCTAYSKSKCVHFTANH